MTANGRAERQLSSDGMEGAITDIGLDSYATAWRYLGVYTDCGGSGGWGSGGWSSWWGGDDDGSDGECSGGIRKLLWAAVRFRHGKLSIQLERALLSRQFELLT